MTQAFDDAAYIDMFLTYLKSVRNLSDNTVRAYATDLSSYAAWCGREELSMLQATHRSLRSYLSYLNRAQYSARTRNRHLSALRGFYKWLNKEGYLEADPSLTLTSPRTSRRLPKTMSDEDAKRLLASCDVHTSSGLRDRAILEFMYATGVRISEIARLDRGDLMLRQGVVRLFGKGSKERDVPLYKTACDWLELYLYEARPKLLAKSRTSLKVAPAEEALFLSNRGRRMSADVLRKMFEAHVLEAGLDSGLTPHAMRHTFATELLTGGADLRVVQELLGHQSLSTTQIYTHLSIERLKDAAKQAHPRAESD